MTTPEPEFEAFVDALRADLPSADDERRVRARLIASGVALTASIAAPSSAAAAASIAASPSAPLALLQKIGAWSWMTKVGVAGVVATASVPAAMQLARHESKAPAAGSVAPAEQRSALRAAARRNEAAPRTAGQPSATVARSEATTAQAPLVQPAAPSEVARVEATPFDARSRARREAPVPAGRAKVSAERVPVGAPPSENAPGAPAAAVAAFADEEGSRSAGPASLPALPAPDTLREETELVDAALYAVRLGEQERARALLEEHARRFPNGALARERLRALERLSAPAATRQEAPR